MKSLMIAFLMFLCTFGLCAYAYFRLKNFSHMLESVWTSIDVQLRYRMEIVKILISAAAVHANNNEGLKRLIAALNVEITTEDLTRRAEEEALVSGALSQFFAAARNIAELKQNENFVRGETVIIQTEDKIVESVENYNANARVFNSILTAFPINLVAKMFDYDPKPPFNFKPTEIK